MAPGCGVCVGPVYSLGRARYVWLGMSHYVSWFGPVNFLVGPVTCDTCIWIEVLFD